MKTYGAQDGDWRVLECLAKGFDDYGRLMGYNNIQDDIHEWLQDPEAKVRRAVIEGLRPWIKKAPFNDNPQLAMNYLIPLLQDSSDHVIKSCHNAIKDILKRAPDLIGLDTLGVKQTTKKEEN